MVGLPARMVVDRPSLNAPLEERVLSKPGSAIARVMVEIENSLRPQPSEPQPAAAPAPIGLVGRSVLGRFNSVIVDFISLFFGFVSLFGHVGNLLSGVSKYQSLTGSFTRNKRLSGTRFGRHWTPQAVFPAFGLHTDSRTPRACWHLTQVRHGMG